MTNVHDSDNIGDRDKHDSEFIETNVTVTI